MENHNGINFYAQDYTDGITYIGPKVVESRGNEISIIPYVSVLTVDLMKSKRGYVASALEKLNDSLSNKNILKGARATPSKGLVDSRRLYVRD